MEEVEKLLNQLYPKDSERILKELEKYLKKIKKADVDYEHNTWYKDLNLYAIYADSVKHQSKKPLESLKDHIDHIADLGCNSLHILPFLESPLVDRGFDVSDYMKIRRGLGTIEDIKKLIEKAKEKGIRVFMDLVFNHVSDQHTWFQKAEEGDEYYREYFITQKTKPEFIKKFKKESAVWAKYKTNGDTKDVNIAFPEYTGKIPHWREGKDGYWYYHTYYPQQVDVNWRNPDVFIEFAKIVMYWTSIGFNFRLDAIPFVGKYAYKEVDENSNLALLLLETFNALSKVINPETVFVVETYEKEETIVDYFGTTNSKQAQLAYNFHLCTYIWVAEVLQDTKFIWEKLDIHKNIPSHAHWINFLRNHDELSLAHLSKSLIKDVSKKLLPNGEPFREGLGISGRTYSLLDNNERRFLNAYFLLSGLPGGMLIPYGDEIGKVNNPIKKLPKELRSDTRNINRGQLTQAEINSKKGKRIFEKMKSFVAARRVFNDYINVWPNKIKAQKEIFAARYKTGSSELHIFVNISDKKQVVKVKHQESYEIIQKLFVVKFKENEIELSPYAGIWLQK